MTKYDQRNAKGNNNDKTPPKQLLRREGGRKNSHGQHREKAIIWSTHFSQDKERRHTQKHSIKTYVGGRNRSTM